jgi:hypothetical protein
LVVKSEKLNNLWTQRVLRKLKMKKINRSKIATIFLMLAMFLNPFGFDALQAILIQLTGSFWNANLVLYCLAGLCFSLYFFFSGNNPISQIKDVIMSIYNDKIKHYVSKK